MRIEKFQTLSRSTREELRNLWNKEYPFKLKMNSNQDFDEYLAGLRNLIHHIVYSDSDKIMAWFFTFEREEGKWFAIIVDSAYQMQGIGKRLLEIGKHENVELNGWVIDHDSDLKENGRRYTSPLNFYIKNGFQVLEHRLETEKISAVHIFWNEKV